MEDVFIPLIIFGAIPLTIWIIMRYRAIHYSKKTETLIDITNKGTSLTPEIIKSLDIIPIKKHRDLRIGLFLIAISLATLYFSSVIPDDEAKVAFSGLTAFPLLLDVF